MKKAVDLFETFHALEPRNIREFHEDFAVPGEVYLAGRALYVLYRSRKVDPATGRQPRKPIDYIHEHDAGVRAYVPDPTGNRPRKTPKWIRDSRAFVLLGKSLGYAYESNGEEVEAVGKTPYPDLYATPCGRALLIIQGRREVLAILWGGSLKIERRGIVH